MHESSIVGPCAALALAAVGALTSSAFAQPQVAGPPSVVFKAGQRLVTADAATTVSGFRTILSDGPRIAANVNTTEGGAIAEFTPGSATILTRLRVGPSMAAVADLRKVKLENGFAIAASGALSVSAEAAYKALVVNPSPGLLDTLWLIPTSGSSSLIAARGNKVTFNGDNTQYFWTYASHPGMTDGGVPYWIGGRTTSWTSPTNDVAMYKGGGTKPDRIIGSGSGVVGGFTLDARRPLRIAFLTPSGNKIYGVFGLAPATGITVNNDEVVGFRMAATTTGLVTVLLREGAFVAGTSGERWRAFDRLVATDKSSCPGTNEWALLARTNTDANHDSVLVVNGQITLREGDTVDGRTLLGDAKDLAMNRQGDWAALWKVREPGVAGAAWVDRNAVIINGRTALLEQATAVGGANVTTLDGPICLGDRSMDGYADISVVGFILPTGTNQVQTAALLNIHAMTGLAGCCPADLATGGETVEGETPDGQVTPADLALFISWYIAADPRADLDNGTGTGTPDGQFTEADLNYYLNHYFTGCLGAI